MVHESGFIDIGHGAFVRAEEIVHTAVRASGPGGQHVNTTSTAVTACLNVAESPSLSSQQRIRILDALASRITLAGQLCVTCRETRSQLENKRRATARLVSLLRTALTPRKRRRPTRVPMGAKKRRQESKKRHSAKKQLRKPPSE